MRQPEPFRDDQVRVVPANHATVEDLDLVFGRSYPKLLHGNSRIPWVGRDEDRHDDGVWAVTCFAVRNGYRGRGLTYVPARAAAEHAPAGGG